MSDPAGTQDGDVQISPNSTGQKVDALSITRNDGSGTLTDETVVRQVVTIGGFGNLQVAYVLTGEPTSMDPGLVVRDVEAPAIRDLLKQLVDKVSALADELRAWKERDPYA